MAALDKMTKYQRACHALEKLKNDTEQSKNFMDEFRNSNALKQSSNKPKDSPNPE